MKNTLDTLAIQAIRWLEYLGSPAWQAECQLQLELSEGQPFQVKADSAVAASLCAFLHHGLISQGQARPENAMIAAVHYGGDTDTVAAMTGSELTYSA
eukprot:scaffold145044_cov23-Tisochrysis_lutea.AAC.1